jgi:SpoVK/Ycf46/Vps4 family AAA+-type ATPase
MCAAYAALMRQLCEGEASTAHCAVCGARNSLLQDAAAHDAVPVDLCAVAEATDGFSGADIRLLCKEAAMRPVRRCVVNHRTAVKSEP